MRSALITSLLVVAAGLAAGTARAEKSTGDSDDQVVVVNAASKIGDIGQIARLRRVLDSRHMLVKLPANLEATLDGRNMLVADVEAIRDAYSGADYETALKIIETDEQRILGEAITRDPIPALAELSQWRGIIASALDQKDDAIKWFRAAYRFNPAWTPDKKLASPRVRQMVRKARREPTETGVLRIDADPDQAMMSIDGGELRSASDKVTLTVGMHLVMITADKRKPYAELVDISAKDPYRIQIALDKETTLDRAARLVDATAAAPAGRPRLKSARALAKLTGVTRMLFVESGDDDHVTVRLYDVETKMVSKPLDLEGSLSSAVIARKVIAALDPDNLVDVNTVVITQRVSDKPAPAHWYSHWYVWAAVGVVAAGSYGSYAYMTREPTSVRGF